MSLIKVVGLCKTYQSGDISINVIREATFTIEPGSFVSFVGPSGSGKSTLLVEIRMKICRGICADTLFAS